MISQGRDHAHQSCAVIPSVASERYGRGRSLLLSGEVVLLYLFVLVLATAFFLVLLSLSSLGGMSPGRVSFAFALVLVACLVAAWGGRRVARGCPSVPWGRCLFSLFSWFSSRFCGSSDGVGLLACVLPRLGGFRHCLCSSGRFAAFPSCGVPARWRDLRHVVLDICRK